MSHTKEEIRTVALDILSGRQNASHGFSQFETFHLSIAQVFALREGSSTSMNQGFYGSESGLDHEDFELCMEVFWDLFRQGIITLGHDKSNREYPWFRVTEAGRNIAEGNSPYFFHDSSSYERAIRSEIPKIHDVTLLYLKESLQAFYSGCILSSSVMLGVATEHTFLLLLNEIESNTDHKSTYEKVFKERTILAKINKFKNILDQNLKQLPSEIKEDLDTNFAGILSIIRTNWNKSGHPTGKIPDREQVFILLQLFIPYSTKLYQLKNHFKNLNK